LIIEHYSNKGIRLKQMYDLFISYSSKDKPAIEKIDSAFKQQELSVWRDDRIYEGSVWSDKIEQALAQSRRVIAFVSPNVIKAKYAFVMAEMQRAFEADKLIPIKIGEFTMPLNMEGITIGLQMILAPDFDTFLTGGGFQRICHVLGKSEAPASSKNVPLSTSQWLENGPPLSGFSLAIAVSVTESASLATITDFAHDLENRIKSTVQSDKIKKSNPAEAFARLTTPLTKQLKNIKAKRYSEKHGRHGLTHECIRFEDPCRASELLNYVWNEYTELHRPVLDWLDHIAGTTDPDVRRRIGLMIGNLARSNFVSVFNRLIGKWMLDDNPAIRDVADMALSIAVFDPAVNTAVKNKIHELAKSNETECLRAAVEFACGHTGSRIQGFSIDILKRVAKSENTDFEVLSTMQEAIEFMLNTALTSDDNSLYDLNTLIVELSDWAQKPEDEIPQRLPMLLFLSLMQNLPLEEPEHVFGGLSLQALIAENKTREATADVFESALRDRGEESFCPRKEAQGILQAWQEEMKEKNSKNESQLLALAQTIYQKCKQTRDRERLVYTFKKSFTEEQLRAQVIYL